ncbi:MAG: Gfo/Idh/MocA family protein [Acidobacteriota bacterium]
MKKITRRKFLDTSTKVASGAAVLAGTETASSAARESPATSPNEKIHVGLIGAGGMGRGDLSDFLRLGEVECLAVADVDEAHLANGLELVEGRRGRRPDGYRDFRRIIDRKDIDVLIVATPDHWHALPTIYGCQSGKDVYVEKPLATSIQEGRAMVDAAHHNHRIVQVGTQQRNAGHFKKAVEFVQSGQLGKIRSVRAWAFIDWKGGLGNPPNTAAPATVDYDFWLGPAPKRPFNPARFHFTFRWFWDYSGGLMTDWGAHMVDVAMWAMGEEPIGAMAAGGKYGYPDDIMETPDTQTSVIQFPSFSLAWEHKLGCGVGPWQREHGVEFHGQNGILVVDRQGWEVHSETDSENRPGRVYRMNGLPRQRGSRDYHFAHVKNFVESVKSRQKPAAEIEIGHKSVIACHLGNIAVRLQRYVAWDPRTETIRADSEAAQLLGREYRQPWKLPRV